MKIVTGMKKRGEKRGMNPQLCGQPDQISTCKIKFFRFLSFSIFHSSTLPPLLSFIFLKSSSLNISLGLPFLPLLAISAVPPTTCSHSCGEYVSSKYYHTKLKGKDFFLPSLFFSFNSELPSLSHSLLISRGTAVWELKENCTRSFSSTYKRFS